ncbi:MAG: PAS domain S-box protein, partial [Candidatus Neomarinimicrobiota bacterium]
VVTAKKYIDRAMAGVPQLFEWQSKTATGKIFWVEVNLKQVILNGQEQILAIVRDISSRKSAEESLKESERRLFTLMTNLPGMAYRCRNDADWTMEFVSSGCRELTGYGSADFINNRRIAYNDIIHPADREAVRLTVEASLARGEHFQSIYRIITKSGKPKWVWEQGIGVFAADGQVLALEGFITDINDQQLARDALRVSEQQYRQLFQNMSSGVAVYQAVEEGRDFIVTDLNSAGEKIVGKSKTDICGRPVLEVFPGLAGTGLVEILHDVWKTGQTVRKHSFLYQDPGIALWTDNSVYKLPTGEIISVFDDVTNRRQAEEDLKSSRELLESFTSAATDGFTIWDSAFNLININHSAMQYLPADTRKEQVIGRYIEDLLPNIRESGDLERYRRVMKSGQPIFIEEHIYAPVFGDRYVNVRAFRVGDGLGIITTDITQRVKAEQELRNYSDRMKNLSAYLQDVLEKERTRIAREIHDELGQAMTAIKFDIAWIEKRITDFPEIVAKTTALRGLIDTTARTIQRISAELRPGLLDDLGLVAAIEWQANEFSQRTGIECRARLEVDDVVFDLTQSTALFRIFQESLTNIARHSRATIVNVQLLRKDDKIRFIIEDNGVGIRPEQISDSRSLGLLGMKERVAFIDGKLKIRGLKTHGTNVTVEIPFKS